MSFLLILGKVFFFKKGMNEIDAIKNRYIAMCGNISLLRVSFVSTIANPHKTHAVIIDITGRIFLIIFYFSY
jgi:hypothetical protein